VQKLLPKDGILAGKIIEPYQQGLDVETGAAHNNRAFAMGSDGAEGLARLTDIARGII
jgi:hypothetical protein